MRFVAFLLCHRSIFYSESAGDLQCCPFVMQSLGSPAPIGIPYEPLSKLLKGGLYRGFYRGVL